MPTNLFHRKSFINSSASDTNAACFPLSTVKFIIPPFLFIITTLLESQAKNAVEYAFEFYSKLRYTKSKKGECAYA